MNAGQHAQSRFQHLSRCVDADGGAERRRDPAQRVSDAGADVDDALAAVLARERDDAIKILSARVGRAFDVRGGGTPELLLDRFDLAHRFGLPFARAAHTAAVRSTRSVGASRGFGVLLTVLSALVALPVCGITGLAAADHYRDANWPLEFTLAYVAVAAGWLALVLTTVSGRLGAIAVAFLALLALLVGLYTFYLNQLN
ncbi:MAG TPA: hypothetical protein VIA63_00615 [Candidatus Limnocylindria bacterium]